MSSSRVWLITGANSGLGLQLALYVLSKGDRVIAAARDVSKIPSSLRAAHPLQLNPSGPIEEVKAAATKALSVHGRIDVLVNMAGYALLGPIETLQYDDVHAQFQTNVFGPIAIIQAILPAMRAQKSGHILNVSSFAGFHSAPVFGAYNASKAALDAFTETLSEEVTPFGIHVHDLIVGYFPGTSAPSRAKTTVAPSDANEGYPSAAALIDGIHTTGVQQGRLGDSVKLSARVWEFIAGDGLAKGISSSTGGKKEWVRLPLGTDCGSGMRAKIQVLQETVDAYEPIWSSTDMDEEKFKQFS